MEEEQKDVTKETEELKESIFDFDTISDKSRSGEKIESKQIQGLTITNYGNGEFIIEINGVPFGKMNEQGNFTYFNLENAKKTFKDEGMDIKKIDLPDLQQAIDLEEKAKKEQEAEQEVDEGEEVDSELELDEEEQLEDSGEEIEEEEKDDEKPELEEEVDKEKEEIAKKYNLNARDVVRFANDERITENERFKGLVEWAKDYDDVYVIPGEDYYSYKFIGSKKGETEEIQAGSNKVVGGKNPDVTIKRVDGEQITEVKPLAMYEIDDKTSIAMVKNEHGEPEAIYCRQQEGDENSYWGSVIPEASGKNVLQQEPETREFMDHRYNSGIDLADKADALERQKGLEQRGLPSDQEGVQLNEIEGNDEQNISKNIEKIEEELMKRDGIVDRATVFPGYYENKAKKVLDLMDNKNKKITFEQAVEQVEEEEKGQREEEGRTQGEQTSDPRRG